MGKTNVIKNCLDFIKYGGGKRIGESLLFKRTMIQLHVNGFVATKTKDGLELTHSDEGSWLFVVSNINDPFYDQFLVPWVDPDFQETKLLGTEPGDVVISAN